APVGSPVDQRGRNPYWRSSNKPSGFQYLLNCYVICAFRRFLLPAIPPFIFYAFTQVSPDHCESPTCSIVTQSDLAYFVTLCSLATFDRAELASQVLSSPNVRLLLEAEPACRDMLHSFHQADYAACLGRLNKLRDLLCLDYFLADHVAVLCRAIRNRALCQVGSSHIIRSLCKQSTRQHRKFHFSANTNHWCCGVKN
ncbi:unnamed protein product, partial [Echinostoma caproni]|uniref:BTB domain-containing protein n=1 Tax=Echinostoma caproni TaxID=27848 RepID=A0A183AUD6_9TREM